MEFHHHAAINCLRMQTKRHRTNFTAQIETVVSNRRKKKKHISLSTTKKKATWCFFQLIGMFVMSLFPYVYLLVLSLVSIQNCHFFFLVPYSNAIFRRFRLSIQFAGGFFPSKMKKNKHFFKKFQMWFRVSTYTDAINLNCSWL